MCLLAATGTKLTSSDIQRLRFKPAARNHFRFDFDRCFVQYLKWQNGKFVNLGIFFAFLAEFVLK